MKINSTLLLMRSTDAYLLYRGGSGAAPHKSSHDFFFAHAEQYIDYIYDLT